MNELAIILKTNTDVHLYEQIYEYIRDEIKEGKLLCGEKLPSTRSLAEHLEVSRSTVNLAYEQLLSEGYVESDPFRGYYVCRIEELYHISKALTNRKGEQGGGGKKYRYDFSPNAIDMSAFPFGSWKKITKDTLIGDRRELFALGHPQGDLELRETIGKYLHASRGVNCTPDQIIVGAGNDYLLMLLRYVLGDRIRIAFENPSYRRAYRIFASFGYQICCVPLDESGMCAGALEAAGANAAYVMPSHQYPTGRIMPIGRRLQLLKWADGAEDRYLIEDDYDSEFRYRGKPIPSLQSSDRAGKVIYIGTFSKSIAPAIRVSYMVLPESLMDLHRQNCYFLSSTVSRIDQTILNEFIRSGSFERHLNKMRKLYKTKHDCILAELRPFEKQFRISGEQAGLHVLLTSRTDREEKEMAELAAGKGIRVYCLSDAFLEPPERPQNATILLGYAGMSETEIRDGLKELREIWNI